MKCPHCLNSFHEQFDSQAIGDNWFTNYQKCPECHEPIIILKNVQRGEIYYKKIVFPKSISRSPIPSEVNDDRIINDYTEASLVLDDSPKASAALSRRCLQYILREKAGVKNGDLFTEIQQVLDSKALPSTIADNLDAVRNIGNFAAHPIKSTSSGEIVDVEPEEAEWNLEVLEQLIDFYYVHPALAQKKRDALNAKLIDAGKPPLK